MVTCFDSEHKLSSHSTLNEPDSGSSASGVGPEAGSFCPVVDPEIEAFADYWEGLQEETWNALEEKAYQDYLDCYNDRKAIAWAETLPEGNGPKTRKEVDFREKNESGLSTAHIRSQRIFTDPQTGKIKVSDLKPVEHSFTFYPDGTLMQLKEAGGAQVGGGTRGNCASGFSKGSRRRMLDKMAMIMRDETNMPWFLTCTFPDHCPTPENCKRAWKVFGDKLRKAFPKFADVWKRELQKRKSGDNEGEIFPHYHSLVWGVPIRFETKPMRGKWVTVTKVQGRWVERIYGKDDDGKKVLKWEQYMGEQDLIYAWVSRNWYESVNTGDFRNFGAGTQTEPIRNFRGVKSYSAKYLGKEITPEEANEYVEGRYWGIRNPQNIPWSDKVVIYMSPPIWRKVERVFRRWLESQIGRKVKRCRKKHLDNPEDIAERLINYFCPDPPAEPEPF